MHKMLSPGMIGSIQLKNRVILPSMCLYFSDKNGNVTDKLYTFVEKRARSGVGGFIIPANPHGVNKPNRASIVDDSFIPQWHRLTDMVHNYGSRVFCQLHPSGAQFGRADFSENPLDHTAEEVKMLIESYAQGALRAKKAGFDGVEIHGAHGHEVALFLSTLINQRTDEYSGDLAGHARIVTEMIKKIKTYAGNDFPVILRISGEERLPGGREIGETVELCRLAEGAGADAIHISVGMPDSEEWECPSSDITQGHIAWMGEIAKKSLHIPVIAVGRIVDWRVAEDIIATGKADFITVGRALLAEPDWMKSVGRSEEAGIRLCIGCNQGCRNKRSKKKSPCTCFQNPMLGQEELVEIKKDETVKEVCIIGAGLSGLEAANVMSQRGHRVTIFEKGKELGGIFRWASVPPGKEEYRNLLRYYERTLSKRGVKFVFRYPVDELPDGFDIYLLAVGGREIIPNLAQNGADVCQAVELLSGSKEPDKDAYVVVGDGLIGYETADFLIQKGKKVILVGDSTDDPLARLGIARWHFMEERFQKGEIRIIRDALVTAVGTDGFTIRHKNGEREERAGRYTYVLACGYSTNEDLYHQVKDTGKEVYLIGSAKAQGDGMDAIHDAFRTTLGIIVK
ncbi:MAG: FAD-dependent oxidoreductase [Dehalobacterium sp.]